MGRRARDITGHRNLEKTAASHREVGSEMVLLHLEAARVQQLPFGPGTESIRFLWKSYIQHSVLILSGLYVLYSIVVTSV